MIPTPVTPAPPAVRCCVICERPYLNDNSYNRHIAYCRRAQSQPRRRSRSCRNCNVAKAKCTFEPQCSRCRRKGVECTYANVGQIKSTRYHHSAEAEPGLPTASGHSTETDEDSIWNMDQDTFATGGVVSWSGVNVASHSTSFQRSDFRDDHDPHLRDGIPQNATPTASQNVEHVAEQPLPPVSRELVMSETPELDFLTRVRGSNPVSQFTATLVVQYLHAFPQMMLRRETMSFFIHGHRYETSTQDRASLPEPTANCIGIAQMFVCRNTESKPFLWRSIKMEQRSFIEKQDRGEYSETELLAAIQAQIMYIIMRALDPTHIDPDYNQEMVVTHQVLCESFTRKCNGPFSQGEESSPSNSWEKWIFAESRRRTVFIWLLIAQTFRVKTGVPCAVVNCYASLPLPSPKTLWEARTNAEWQSEYNAYMSMPHNGMKTFGDLIDACREGNMLHLAAWNATADNFGLLLRLGAEMMS